jgi:hypothetical protein
MQQIADWLKELGMAEYTERKKAVNTMLQSAEAVLQDGRRG